MKVVLNVSQDYSRTFPFGENEVSEYELWCRRRRTDEEVVDRWPTNPFPTIAAIKTTLHYITYYTIGVCVVQY